MKTLKEIQDRIFEVIKKSRAKKIHAASYNSGIFDAVRLINEGRQDELIEILMVKR